MSEEIKLTLTQEEFDLILIGLIVRAEHLKHIGGGIVWANQELYDQWHIQSEANNKLIKKLSE